MQDIEDSDFKLSYDLYYLRNFNTWLDLVILFRTIKAVLKAEAADLKASLLIFLCGAWLSFSDAFSVFARFCFLLL